MKSVHLGDKGSTWVFGKNLSKSESAVESIGGLDELVSFIGVCRAFDKNKMVDLTLEKIQKDLFSIGSEISSAISGSKKFKATTKNMVTFLDEKIEEIEKQLPELARFILPNGTQLASLLHVARAVCRRAERSIVKLSKETKLNENIIPYVNRLSDVLFSLARYANKKEGVKEVEWKAD